MFTMGDYYNDLLDDLYPDCTIAGFNFTASRALKEMDPIAYRQGFLDYMDGMEIICNDCNHPLPADYIQELDDDDEYPESCRDAGIACPELIDEFLDELESVSIGPALDDDSDDESDDALPAMDALDDALMQAINDLESDVYDALMQIPSHSRHQALQALIDAMQAIPALDALSGFNEFRDAWMQAGIQYLDALEYHHHHHPA